MGRRESSPWRGHEEWHACQHPHETSSRDTVHYSTCGISSGSEGCLVTIITGGIFRAGFKRL